MLKLPNDAVPNDAVRTTPPASTPEVSRRRLLQGAAVGAAGFGLPNFEHVAAAQATPVALTVGEGEWGAYGRDPGAQRASPLTQITPENAGGLQPAWEYRTGELDRLAGTPGEAYAAFEATPLMVDGTLYFSTPSNVVIALDGATGRERWRYDPEIDIQIAYSNFTSRGVSLWTDPAAAAGEPGHRRLLFGTLDGRLIAIDARSGAPIASFGGAGNVDLKVGVGNVEPGMYSVTSPPALTADLVIVGSTVGDNRAAELERGIVRGYDVRTGELRWTWDPVPRDEADPRYASWVGPRAHLTGGANAWAPLSVDLARDLVFVPTSSASPDYYGGERRGENLSANSLAALRASTGDLVWATQLVHHDLWDYDVPMQPLVLDLPRGDDLVPAVAVGTKQGHLFVVHRETGEHLFAVEERAVPASTVPGEEAWPTQPFPTELPLFGLRELTADDAFGLDPESRARGAAIIGGLRAEGLFTPPSLDGSLQAPGYFGGFNWGGLTFDAARSLLIGATNRIAGRVALLPRDEPLATPDSTQLGYEVAEQDGTPYRMQRSILIDPETLVPYSPPPWGTLAAVDLRDGSLAWEVPLGLAMDPAEVPEAVDWGTVNLGGPITTASGLTIIAATVDGFIRAFATESGEMLWEMPMPAAGHAMPMTYEVDGTQFVVIAAGGSANVGAPLADYLLAFSLPQAD